MWAGALDEARVELERDHRETVRLGGLSYLWEGLVFLAELELRALVGLADPRNPRLQLDPVLEQLLVEAELHEDANVLVDPSLLVALDARVGDSLQLGFATFTIAGTLENVPGDAAIASAFGPRVYIPAAQLDKTGLLVFGSRAEYEAMMAVPPGADVEACAVTRADHDTLVRLPVTLDERAVVVGAAVLDREQLAGAVEHADLEVLPLHQAHAAGREVVNGADVDHFGHVSPTTAVGLGSLAAGVPSPAVPPRSATRDVAGLEIGDHKGVLVVVPDQPDIGAPENFCDQFMSS